MWKETTDKIKNLKIYNEELRDFLPERILDFHVHVFNGGTIPEGDPGVELPGVYIKSYTIPQMKEDMKKIFPGKDCSQVVFGFPEYRYNSDINNRYVAESSDHKRVFPFRLIRPDENLDAIEKGIKAMNFLGVKPYLNYVRSKEVDDIEIEDMLPNRIMEVINSLGLIVMLHIPRKERLADPVNQEQIALLSKNYTNCRIVLAHTGRAYYLSNIIDHLVLISHLDNIYCDISMLNNWEILEYLFSNFDRKRILYGSDLPIGVCGGKSVEINDQYTYVTSKPWKLSISDDHGKLVFTSFIYEGIRAIKKAVNRLNLDEDFLEDLFFNNGMNLLKTVM